MLNKEPNPERARLGFRDAVLSSFKFLNTVGLRPVQEEMTFIRYESPEVFVNVHHGRASFELCVEIGRLREPRSKLTLYDIVAWAGAEKAEGLGEHVAFQVSSREGVQEFVPKLAELVKKHAAPFLRGDDAAFDSALEIQSERARDYAKGVNRNVTTIYGLNNFTDEIKAAFQKHGTKRIYLAYDRDEPGERAAQAHSEEIMQMGIECFRVQFPRSQDANEFALKQQPAAKWLGMSLTSAAWLGKGKRPTVKVPKPAVIEAAQQIEEKKEEPAAQETGAWGGIHREPCGLAE
jgi:hypothetical protein